MASFKAKLFIDDEERNVLNVNQTFKQIYDITGRPEGKPYGEPLYLTLESTINDGFFYQNMFDHSQMISGEIVFYKRNGQGTLYKLEFANAHILGMKEDFDAYDTQPLHFNLKIGWGIIKVNGVVYEEAWNPDNPFEGGAEATVIENNAEPELVDYYITDIDDNEIDKAKPGDTIILHVITKHLHGESLTLNLKDPTADYKFRGNILVNYKLEDYIINLDHEEIKLEVIKQGATT